MSRKLCLWTVMCDGQQSAFGAPVLVHLEGRAPPGQHLLTAMRRQWPCDARQAGHLPIHGHRRRLGYRNHMPACRSVDNVNEQFNPGLTAAPVSANMHTNASASYCLRCTADAKITRSGYVAACMFCSHTLHHDIEWPSQGTWDAMST